MKELFLKNWSRALGEVAASMIGALGAILLVAWALTQQDPTLELRPTFDGYFAGGQIGLSILSVCGVTFIALLRHKLPNDFLSVLLYVFLIGPMVLTAIFIGLNPGFVANGLSQAVLGWLWWIFFWIHFLWFIILLLEPSIPNPQEAGKAQQKRVDGIKAGAANRA